jgi:hypothetical protein
MIKRWCSHVSSCQKIISDKCFRELKLSEFCIKGPPYKCDKNGNIDKILQMFSVSARPL